MAGDNKGAPLTVDGVTLAYQWHDAAAGQRCWSGTHRGKTLAVIYIEGGRVPYPWVVSYGRHGVRASGTAETLEAAVGRATVDWSIRTGEVGQ